ALDAGDLPDVLTELSGWVAQPDPIGNRGIVETYRIDTNADGLFSARVHSPSITTRLSLLDSQGRVLVQSDGRSPTDPANEIDAPLPSGSYLLRLESPDGVGDYALTTTLTPAVAPYQPLTAGVPDTELANSFAIGDFNGDGRPDLAASDGIHLGVGDGTFRT